MNKRTHHHRRSIRMKGYDYSQPGMYFVTICVKGNDCCLGRIVDGEMELSPEGVIVRDYFERVHRNYPNVFIDCFVIMPNHVHAVVEIREQSDFLNPGRGEETSPEKGRETLPLQKVTLSQIVAFYKYQTTKRINQEMNIQGSPLWQRNYYERIIRNDRALDAIRAYILANPANWDRYSENPYNPNR